MRVLSRPCGIICGVNTPRICLWKRGIARRQGTLRICSRYLHELACDLWPNPGVFDLGVVQPVCGLVGRLRPCRPLLWSAGSATRIAIGHFAPTRIPPLGHMQAICALRPWYWVL